MPDRILLAATILAFTLGAAQAADIIIDEQPEVVPVEPAPGWAGPYAGIFASYNDFGFDWNVPFVPAGGFTGTIDEWGGGVFVGYNFQSGNFVYGLEADGEFLSGEANFSGVPAAGLLNVSVDWTASVRGRLGWDAGQYMPYAFVGATWAHLDTNIIGGLPSQDDIHHGYTLGAGVDAMIGANGFARLEYGYSSYDEKRYRYCPPGCEADEQFDRHAIRLGVGLRF